MDQGRPVFRSAKHCPAQTLTVDFPDPEGAAKSVHQGVSLTVPGGNDVARLDSNLSQAGASSLSPQSQQVVTLPRRFRSAFILYSAVRHKQVRDQLGQSGKCEKVSFTLCLDKGTLALPAPNELPFTLAV